MSQKQQYENPQHLLYYKSKSTSLKGQAFNSATVKKGVRFKVDEKYIQQKRMCAINYDLKNGEKPEQLAYKYNFNNYSTFYRAYKKHFGVSPSIVKKLDC